MEPLTLMGPHARFWAAYANVLRLGAILFAFSGILGGAYALLLLVQPSLAGPNDARYANPSSLLVAPFMVGLAWVLWHAKRPLIWGHPGWARPAAAVVLAMSLINTLGFGLIGLLIAYVATPDPRSRYTPGDPEPYGHPPAASQQAGPDNWLGVTR